MAKRKCPNQIVFSYQGVAIPLFCKSWSCGHCRVMNARFWAKRAMVQFPIGGLMLTFTQSRRLKSVPRAYELLPKQWDAFRKIMQRQYPRDFIYIAFVEGQAGRGGMPHFHVIANHSPIKTPRQKAITALRYVARRCGFGYQCWIDEVTDEGAAWYVAKYCSKGDPAMPKGFRRVRTSRSFAELIPQIRDPVILPKSNEKLADYFMRVSDETGLSVDDILERYTALQDGLWIKYSEHDLDN